MIPGNRAIAVEMIETGLAPLQAIRRIQQREAMRARLRNGRFPAGTQELH